MTFSRSRENHPKNPHHPQPRPILRSSAPAFNEVEQAIEADRRYFTEHPETDEYVREFCPGEFGTAELPEIPPGFRYATHVSVLHRDSSGRADGRYRQLMAVCDHDLGQLLGQSERV
jgi:hypothetical protein